MRGHAPRTAAPCCVSAGWEQQEGRRLYVLWSTTQSEVRARPAESSWREDDSLWFRQFGRSVAIAIMAACRKVKCAFGHTGLRARVVHWGPVAHQCTSGWRVQCVHARRHVGSGRCTLHAPISQRGQHTLRGPVEVKRPWHAHREPVGPERGQSNVMRHGFAGALRALQLTLSA